MTLVVETVDDGEKARGDFDCMVKETIETEI